MHAGVNHGDFLLCWEEFNMQVVLQIQHEHQLLTIAQLLKKV